MSEDRFSESDLLPSDDDKRAATRALVEKIAATVAVLATGVWVGGMIALGACAAPFVFRLTPAPFSGDAMGAAFARFDSIALGAAVFVLGAEVARTWAAGPRGRRVPARIRRIVAIAMTFCAAYIGLALTPKINEMHRAGVQRGQGPAGAELERIHKRAELVGKAETALGVSLVILHMFTLGGGRPEDYEDDDTVSAPLPPGPM